METASIKPHNDFDFPLNPSHTKSCFLIAAAANGIHNNHYSSNDTIAARYQVSDIEMVALQAGAYTSLKDLLPTSPSSILSPTNSRKDSWREIPIKDPLLQHAAWAYLQPMSEARDSDDRNLVEKLKEKCCGVFACFNDVLLVIGKGWFSESDGRRKEAQKDDGEEDKVDRKV